LSPLTGQQASEKRRSIHPSNTMRGSSIPSKQTAPSSQRQLHQLPRVHPNHQPRQPSLRFIPIPVSLQTRCLPPHPEEKQVVIFLQLVESIDSRVNHPVGVSILSTKKHRPHECNTHGEVPPSVYKGPCTGVEAKRRIRPMVLPQ